MKPLWTSKELINISKGKCNKSFIATGVSIDSRTLKRGDLFIALKDKRDGHDFVEDAFSKGASAAIISKKVKIKKELPFLLVKDVNETFNNLALAARKRSKAKFVAITGSAGKTSTKEMLKSALSKNFSVHATKKNFNNKLGVTLTLSNLHSNVDYVIVEIGMNDRGEISPLSKLVSPHIAIITSIGQSHLENLKSVENIMLEKLDICDGLDKKGICLIPGDFENSNKLLKKIRKKHIDFKVFGSLENCEYRLCNAKIRFNSTIGIVKKNNSESFFIKIKSLGIHNLINAVSVIAVFDFLKLDITKAILNLSNWKPSFGRGNIKKIYFDDVIQDKFYFVIDESYNSNPLSVCASLKTLSCLENINLNISEKIKIRKIAILGDMLELGDQKNKIHRDLIHISYLNEIDCFYCVGQLMSNFFQLLPKKKQGKWFSDVNMLNKDILKFIQNGDIIMIKGSNSIGLNKVVNHLLSKNQNNS